MHKFSMELYSVNLYVRISCRNIVLGYTNTQTGRQTCLLDRQTDRQTDYQIDRQIDRRDVYYYY